MKTLLKMEKGWKGTGLFLTPKPVSLIPVVSLRIVFVASSIQPEPFQLPRLQGLRFQFLIAYITIGITVINTFGMYISK